MKTNGYELIRETNVFCKKNGLIFTTKVSCENESNKSENETKII